jgi:hypothetical protein
MVLADGISWQRAVNPGFDAGIVLPLILKMVHCLLAKTQDRVGTDKEKPQ